MKTIIFLTLIFISCGPKENEFSIIPQWTLPIGDTAKWVSNLGVRSRPDSGDSVQLSRVDVYRCIHCGESIYQQANHGAWIHNTFSDGGYISCLDHKEKKYVQGRKSTLAEPTPEVYEYFRDHTFDNSDTWERIVIHEPIQLPLEKDTLSHVVLVIAEDFKGSSIYKFSNDSVIVFPGPIVIENAEQLSLFP